MSKEEKITGLEFLKDIPKTNDLVSAYGSVNLEQLNNVVKRLKQIPNYDELLKDNEKLSQENKQLKELKYKFFDNSGDEESFTLEDYLEISNKLYDYEKENKQLKSILTELEEHCEVMLRIFEKMSEEQKQEQLDKYVIYDKFLGKIQELKKKYRKESDKIE